MPNKLETLTAAILNREEEIFGYQINIDNYTALLKSLPAEWPEHLEKYNNANDKTFLNLPEADAFLVSDLLFRTSLEKTLMAEKIERRKAMQIMHAIESQL